LHFVEIGGCGMSGLALVARALGAEVTGSNLRSTVSVESLERQGLTGIRFGHDRANVPGGQVEVVYCSAIPDTNVELMVARERGRAVVHRSVLVAEITRLHRTVAVGGAHGKSSTAALLAHVLTVCGQGPSYVVGALIRPPGAHAAAGAGGLLVIEADESDRSLLNYQVDIAVVTNVDLDHVGAAGGYTSVEDVAAVLGAFAAAANRAVLSVQAAGHLRGNVDDPLIVVPVPVPGTVDRFRLRGGQGHGVVFETAVPGRHHVDNAALVVATALELGCRAEDVAGALRSFPGLARAFRTARAHPCRGAGLRRLRPPSRRGRGPAGQRA